MHVNALHGRQSDSILASWLLDGLLEPPFHLLDCPTSECESKLPAVSMSME